MTLTLYPSTSIRPLGEEHLRMFRRMTGSTPDQIRLRVPNEARQRVTFSRDTLEYPSYGHDARDRVVEVKEALMDYCFIREFSGGTFVYVDWINAPKPGWHRIDRANETIIFTGLHRALDRPGTAWHETLFVYKDTIKAIKKAHFLALGGELALDGGVRHLFLTGGYYGLHYAGRAAVVEGALQPWVKSPL